MKTSASKPGAIGVPSSTLKALARAITSSGSEMSAGVILFITSAAVYPSIRSAPTLKIWMTPFASVAMLEKLALLKIALCSAPVLSRASVWWTSKFRSAAAKAASLGLGMLISFGPIHSLSATGGLSGGSHPPCSVFPEFIGGASLGRPSHHA